MSHFLLLYVCFLFLFVLFVCLFVCLFVFGLWLAHSIEMEKMPCCFDSTPTVNAVLSSHLSYIMFPGGRFLGGSLPFQNLATSPQILLCSANMLLEGPPIFNHSPLKPLTLQETLPGFQNSSIGAQIPD